MYSSKSEWEDDEDPGKPDKKSKDGNGRTKRMTQADSGTEYRQTRSRRRSRIYWEKYKTSNNKRFKLRRVSADSRRTETTR